MIENRNETFDTGPNEGIKCILVKNMDLFSIL